MHDDIQTIIEKAQARFGEPACQSFWQNFRDFWRSVDWAMVLFALSLAFYGFAAFARIMAGLP